MSIAITVWLILTVLLGVIASLAIWARGASRPRMLAVVAFLLGSPIAAAALGFTLGWPVPYTEGITVSAGKHTILGSKMIVGEGIYLLLDRGVDTPRYYILPWSASVAEQLQQALEDKGKEGTAGVEVQPFEFSWSRKPPKFYADPQIKMLPDKLTPPPAPTYERDA